MRTVVVAAVWLAAIGALTFDAAWLECVVGGGAVTAALLLYRDRRGMLLALAVLGVLALAWLRWQAATTPVAADSIAWWAAGERHTVSGRVQGRPEVRGASQRFVVAVTEVTAPTGPVAASGAIQVRVAVTRTLRTGDLVRLDGVLDEPPLLDGFDYRSYLARRGIYAVMEYPRLRVTGHVALRGFDRWSAVIHDRAHDAIWDNLPVAQAALAEGILLGQRSGIPRDINEDFQQAGVSHLIVISGFNIALVGGMVLAAGAPLLGRRRAVLLALASILLYGAFVGMTPPVARAVVMGAAALLAILSGRPHGAGVALLVAAALLTVLDPMILSDLSFQLSVAATGGILVLAPAALALGRRVLADDATTTGQGWRSLAVAAWDVLAVTLAATVATLPLLLLSFGRLSVVSPLANLLLVPLFPPIMLLGGAGVAIAMLIPPLGAIALAPVGALLWVSTVVARATAAMPGATVAVHWFGPVHALAVYAVLGACVLGRIPRPRTAAVAGSTRAPTPLRVQPLVLAAFAPAALLCVLIAGALPGLLRDNKETRVDVLNLPGAPATMVTLPGGARVLVNTGLAPEAAREALDAVIPGGTRRIAAVVITRDMPSTTGGLAAILRRTSAPLLLIPPEADGTRWVAAARDRGVTVAPLAPGLTIGNQRGHLEIWPSAERGRWLVRARHGERVIALEGTTGDGGLTRSGGSTSLYVRDRSSVMHAQLRAGERAALVTRGATLSLIPPAGRKLALEPCPSCGEPDR